MDDKIIAIILLLLSLFGMFFMFFQALYAAFTTSSNVILANEETIRKIIQMYKDGDYIVLNQHLHHYQFEVDDTFYVLGIVSLVSLMNELEE